MEDKFIRCGSAYWRLLLDRFLIISFRMAGDGSLMTMDVEETTPPWEQLSSPLLLLLLLVAVRAGDTASEEEDELCPLSFHACLTTSHVSKPRFRNFFGAAATRTCRGSEEKCCSAVAST